MSFRQTELEPNYEWIKTFQEIEVKIHNCLIVSNGFFLLHEYQVNINMKVCILSKAITYIYQSIFKQKDWINIYFQNENCQVVQYLKDQYNHSI